MNRGQAALIIILVTAVVVTVVVSTIGRTVTDVRQSSQTTESLQALNAAEAGIEHALLQLEQDPNESDEACDILILPAPAGNTGPCPLNHRDSTGSDISSQSRYWFTFENYPRINVDLSYELGPISQGDTRTVWFVYQRGVDMFPGNAAGNEFYTTPLNLTFAVSVPNTQVELQYVYDTDSNCNGASIALKRELRNVSTGTVISIDPASGVIDPSLACLSYVRVRPIDNPVASLKVDNYDPATFGNDFPQGTFIDASGAFLGSGEGSQQATRRIHYVRLNDAPPPFSDFAIYAGGGIVR